MTAFWTQQLILATVINAVVSALQIGAYAARYAGAKTHRVGTSISLFNLFMTASRLATLFVTPALGALADKAVATARVYEVAGKTVHAPVSAEIVHQFDLQMRVVILGATVGTTIGAILLPMFIYIFVRGITSFERRNSVIRAALRMGDPRVMMDVLSQIRLPSIRTVLASAREQLPMKLIVGNTLVYAIYTIGVLAAYYASVLNLEARATTTGLSGIVNGIGTIAFTLFVDPTSALMVDQTVKGERPVSSIRAMVIALSATAIIGTVVSQLLLWPGAWIIAHGATLFVGRH